jgi:hypothetical protein
MLILQDGHRSEDRPAWGGQSSILCQRSRVLPYYKYMVVPFRPGDDANIRGHIRHGVQTVAKGHTKPIHTVAIVY